MKVIEVPQKEVYAYEDYAKLPEGAPYQLVGGRLVMTLAPSTHHQDTSMRLSVKLAGLVMEKDLGKVFCAPIDVYFEETETYQPDIIFISKQRVHIIESERVKGAPDLVVEILSSSTVYYELRKKFKIYEKHGVKEYWIVDPESKSIIIYENRAGKFVQAQEVEEKGKVESKVISGFELEAESMW